MSKLSYAAVEHEDELLTLREQVNLARIELEKVAPHRNSSVVAQVKYDSAWVRWDNVNERYMAALRKRVLS